MRDVTMVRGAWRVVLCGGIALVALATWGTQRADAAAPLGSMKLAAGTSTWGQAFPAGAVRPGRLAVGRWPVQLDVKRTWGDGSVKFAVVTTVAAKSGTYQLVAKQPARSPGARPMSTRTSTVVATIDGVQYRASFPFATPGADAWLDGPLIREWRVAARLVRDDGTPHPSLRAIGDLRVWRGGTKLDVALDNTLDVPGAGRVTYDLRIQEGSGATSYQRAAVRQGYLTRWRVQVPRGAPLRTPEHVRALTERAGALPRFLRLVADRVDRMRGAAFDPLGQGSLDAYMPNHGGRPELAPYPDWAARYLVHAKPAQRAYVLRHGDLSGSWPMHVRTATGSFVSLDETPGYWLDVPEGRGNRTEGQDAGPVGTITAESTGPLVPDRAHQPSLAFVPYIATGDRYYADEVEAWAHYCLIGTWPGAANERRGAQGLLATNETRGIAWCVRNLSDAAAWLPSSNPATAYLAERVRTNLAWLDEYAGAAGANPLGALSHGIGFDDAGSPDGDGRLRYSVPRPWQNNYVAWAIDHANGLGFSGGGAFRSSVVRFQTKLFTDPAIPDRFGAPYYLQVGTALGATVDGETSASDVRFFGTFGQMWTATLAASAARKEQPVELAGWYGVDARLMLLQARRDGVSGAPGAYGFVWNAIAKRDHIEGMPDLALRAGWAIAGRGER